MTLARLRRLARNEKTQSFAIEEMIKHASLHHERFTSDVIWDYLGDIEPSEPRVIGAAFVKLARAGYIRATDRVMSSKRRACHYRPVRVWQSRVFVREVSE